MVIEVGGSFPPSRLAAPETGGTPAKQGTQQTARKTGGFYSMAIASIRRRHKPPLARLSGRG
ncbi:MAG TPA: hypothetical protein VFR86_26555, partial [Burkholderiaceae bacterium]|nr:hypothetical protein [Burkholderiaceae bacterium]